MGFGEAIVKILAWIWDIWPVRIIRSYQRGVRFHKGIAESAHLEPGIRCYWPLIGAIEVLDVVEDVIDLPTQNIITSDGKTISFSANISYEVVDAVLYYTQVQDFEANLSRIACGHLAMKIREWSWSELQGSQKELEASLRTTLTTRVKGWGVKVLECRLTDCVPAKQFRLIQS